MTALPLTACTSSNRLEEEHTGTAQQMLHTKNGLTSNGLTSNGLTSNGLTSTGIPLFGLSANGLSGNSNVMNKIVDSYSKDLMDYITTCALPAGEDHNFTITLDDSSLLTLHGSLALAPQWEYDTGTCDDACKTWVSGCILGRLNYLGEHVDISLRGHGIATSQAELDQYESAEAVYFGDLFGDPTKRYACRIGGSTLIERVCGPESGWGDCVVEIMPHDCSEYCSGPDATDGHYENCQDPHDSSITYAGSVTIYRDMDADAGADAGTD